LLQRFGTGARRVASILQIATIETEGEFFKIAIPLPMTDCALVATQKLALKQRNKTMTEMVF